VAGCAGSVESHLGRYWDPLYVLATLRAKLLDILNTTVDGEYQNYKAKGGRLYTRWKLLWPSCPETKKTMVAQYVRWDIWALNLWSLDPVKCMQPTNARQNKVAQGHSGQKPLKCMVWGSAGEGKTSPTTSKKMDMEAIRHIVTL